MVADDDGRGELLLLDQQLLTGSADTHTHTHTANGVGTEKQPVLRAKRSGTSQTVALDVPMTGVRFMEYWLWRCRTSQLDRSLHPLRQYDPKALEYAESLIQTQE